MILIDPTNAAISTLYGDDGYRELHAFMKKLRLDRTALKSEGDPVREYLIVPVSKIEGGIVSSTARLCTRVEFSEAQATKMKMNLKAQAKPNAEAKALASPWRITAGHEPEDTLTSRRDEARKPRGNRIEVRQPLYDED